MGHHPQGDLLLGIGHVLQYPRRFRIYPGFQGREHILRWIGGHRNSHSELDDDQFQWRRHPLFAADLQVLNNTISNGSNAGIENATKGAGSGALRRQVYASNTISLMPNEAIVIYGVDSTIPAGSVQIVGNHLDTIGQINGSAGQTGILVIPQAGGNNVAPANVSISGNVCHDCRSFGILESSGNTQVSDNLFIVDKYNAYNFLSFTFPMKNFLIARNAGYATAAGKSLESVYVLNPGYQTGNFAWNNVTVQENVWRFPVW